MRTALCLAEALVENHWFEVFHVVLQIGFTTTSNITLTTTMSYNNASFVCHAANSATPSDQYISASTAFYVFCTQPRLIRYSLYVSK